MFFFSTEDLFESEGNNPYQEKTNDILKKSWRESLIFDLFAAPETFTVPLQF